MLPASLSFFFLYQRSSPRSTSISLLSPSGRFIPASAIMISLVPPARTRDREISFANFIFAMLLLFAYLLRPSALSFVRVAVERSQEVGRFSSRHDDECCNVRLEARNSMVCSRAVYGVYYGDCPKARVYEISRLRRCSRCSLSLSLPLPFLSARRERENAGFIRAPFRAIFFP